MRRSVVFTAPYQVEIHSDIIPVPAPGEVLVEAALSGISAGTELLIYRNQFPQELLLDSTIEGLDQHFSYPTAYGYTLVGKVVRSGSAHDKGWEGRSVFLFAPHGSHALCPTAALHPIPELMAAENALFLPNMETAVNLVHDGAPLLGEKVAVFGQGVVGLLVTSLLHRFPVKSIITFDSFSMRREASLKAGANEANTPEALSDRHLAGSLDLIFELSGNPIALDQAIPLLRYGGRIVVGSWYGEKTAPLRLGSHFHRNRIQIISSQVSTIGPALTGRWDKARRFEAAWEMIEAAQPAGLITHRFPVEQAAEAYRLLDGSPESALQVVLTYTTD